MAEVSVTEQQFHEELQELLAAAKGMTEGNFRQTVNVKARGIVGELARYINHTLHNLQQLDPTVEGSRRDIPKVAVQLREIIEATEHATNRVLEQAEHLLDEHAQIDQHLQQAAAAAGALPGTTPAGLGDSLAAAQGLQQGCQDRAMDIMAAMEFQDLTTQKIQKLIALVAEVEARLLQLLVIFRVEDASAEGHPADLVVETCATDAAALCNQDLVDQLLRQVQAGS
jgi:chemotaxis regulatin CheY-phosphate phosphatase CheZ